MTEPTTKPAAADAASTEHLTAIEGDRWRIEPHGDDTYTLHALTSVGPSTAIADPLQLTAADIPELANLFAVATDLLNGMPPSESTPKLVFLDGFGPHPKVIFTAFGQPPPMGASVTLPNVGEVHVWKVRWFYERSGASRVEVVVESVAARARAAAHSDGPRIAEHES